MRPITVRLAGTAGFTDWIPLNRLQKLTNVGLAVVLSSGATLTYTVQHTFDPLYPIAYDWTATRAVTTVTVNKINHGLSVGDWVLVTNAGAPLDGQFPVASVPNANSFTYPCLVDAGVTEAGPNRGLQTARVFPHAVLFDKTVRADSNYAFPTTACRLNVSAWTSGFAELTILQGN